MSQSSFSSSDPPDWATQGTSPQTFRASRSSSTPWVFLLEQGVGATPSNYEKTPLEPENKKGLPKYWLPREEHFHWFENVSIDSDRTTVYQAEENEEVFYLPRPRIRPQASRAMSTPRIRPQASRAMSTPRRTPLFINKDKILQNFRSISTSISTQAVYSQYGSTDLASEHYSDEISHGEQTKTKITRRNSIEVLPRNSEGQTLENITHSFHTLHDTKLYFPNSKRESESPSHHSKQSVLGADSVNIISSSELGVLEGFSDEIIIQDQVNHFLTMVELKNKCAKQRFRSVSDSGNYSDYLCDNDLLRRSPSLPVFPILDEKFDEAEYPKIQRIHPVDTVHSQHRTQPLDKPCESSVPIDDDGDIVSWEDTISRRSSAAQLCQDVEYIYSESGLGNGTRKPRILISRVGSSRWETSLDNELEKERVKRYKKKQKRKYSEIFIPEDPTSPYAFTVDKAPGVRKQGNCLKVYCPLLLIFCLVSTTLIIIVYLGYKTPWMKNGVEGTK